MGITNSWAYVAMFRADHEKYVNSAELHRLFVEAAVKIWQEDCPGGLALVKKTTKHPFQRSLFFFQTEEEASNFIKRKELKKQQRQEKNLKVLDCEWELKKLSLQELIRILFGENVTVVPE